MPRWRGTRKIRGRGAEIYRVFLRKMIRTTRRMTPPAIAISNTDIL
jgi:hypothetical protein